MSNLSEEIINRYLTGQCSEEELIEVNAWMKESEENARQLFRMEEIYHLGKFDQYTDEQRILRAEKQLYKKLDEEKGKQSKILSMHRWMKYAAVIAVMLVMGGGVGYWFYQNGNNQQMMVAVASEGIVKEVALPDGSKVWLNNAATLKYPREFSEKERNVYLEGEAYFEVAKDAERMFVVETAHAIVKVLGTSFDVCDYEEDGKMFTTLEEGVVEMEKADNSEQMRMAPGEQVCLVEGGRTRKYEVETALFTSWRSGRLVFKNMSLEDLMRNITRWYDVEVKFERESLKKVVFTGDMKKYEDLRDVLEFIELTSETHFLIEGNKIIVY